MLRKYGYRRKRPFRRRTRRRSMFPKRYRRKYVMAKPINTRQLVKLTYVDTLGPQTISSNGNTYFNYSASLFDPYTSLGGHQPLYFDQYAAMYGSYRTFGIAYEIIFQTTTGSSNNLWGVTYANTDNSAIATFSSAAERKGSKITGFGGNQRGRLKGYVSVANVWCVPKKEVLLDDQFSAVVSTDPVKNTYIFFQVFNNSPAPVEIICQVRLRYYSEFFRPTTIAQS